MSQIKTSILGKLQDIEAAINSVALGKLVIDPVDSSLDVEKTTSNFELLSKTIQGFFTEERSEYFPAIFLNDILNKTTTILDLLTKYQTNPDDLQSGIGAVKNMDALYGLCLQIGVISFGFHQKISNEALENARGVHKKYLKHLRNSEKKLDEILLEIQSKHDQFKKPIESELQSLKKRFATFSEDEEKKLSEFSAALDGLEEKSKEALASFQDIEEKKVVAEKTLETIGTLGEEVDTAHSGVTEKLKSATQLLESIKSSKISIKEEVDGITEFYSEIENYQKKITEIKKEANDKFNQLNLDFENKLVDLRKETEEIVGTNKKHQTEIGEHLSRALGASLFKAFDVRRGHLNLGKNAWRVLLVLFILIGVGLTLWLAKDLTGVPDRAFFLKLTAYIPIAFFIGFAAKQYSNERRTEEEYAFKSAISISLEPYRNLLNQITTDQSEEEAKFVRRLILEIFDNPVKRIYTNANGNHKSFSNGNNAKQMKEMLLEIKEKWTSEDVKSVKSLLDSMQEIIKN